MGHGSSVPLPANLEAQGVPVTLREYFQKEYASGVGYFGMTGTAMMMTMLTTMTSGAGGTRAPTSRFGQMPST